jgi:hypothetical protein
VFPSNPAGQPHSKVPAEVEMQVPPLAQDVAVQGFTGVSHVVPVYSGGQLQLKLVTSEGREEQVPEFEHGFGLQAMTTSQSDPVSPMPQPQLLSTSG